MEEYFFVCKADELREKEGKKFIINDVEIALFKVDGKIYALNNLCPHQHSALIYDGFIEEGNVVCPAHGWEFDLKTGRTRSGCKGLDTYEVKIENGKVYAKVYQKEFKW